MKKILLFLIILILSACSNQTIEIKEYSLANDVDGNLDRTMFELEGVTQNVFVSEYILYSDSKTVNRNIKLYLNAEKLSRLQVELVMYDTLSTLGELVTFLFNNDDVDMLVCDYELCDVKLDESLADEIDTILTSKYPTTLEQNSYYGGVISCDSNGITINEWDKLNISIKNKKENEKQYISYYYISE